MSKARYKVTVKKAKGGKRDFLTKVPLRVEKNDNPNASRLYQTKAQITLRPKTTKGGRPRVSGRP